MSRPVSPSPILPELKNVVNRPPLQKASSYRLFPTIAEPTPPTTPIARKLSNGKEGGSQRSRSVDHTKSIALAQQDADVKTVPVKRGRKVSVQEVKHMSTVQEIPSPTVSIPYSFLPRSSEDTGHARSNSAPGDFVRDSQVLPTPRVDLSKPQWTSKHADSHPAKGLGLSMPASVSADRIDQKRAPPSSKPKPNLTVEIKRDERMKPKAIAVRDEQIDDDNELPPPPPPKSPRHDSRNQSLNNIQYDPRKVRRTRSRTTSRSSNVSHSSPDSAHPSEEATVFQGSMVKANLVDTPSPSSGSPALPKPVIQHGRESSFSPLSGDVRIKELMATTTDEAKEDLERPPPPPITPGQPRVASMARVVSIPTLPKSVSVEKAVVSKPSEQSLVKPVQSDSTETIVPLKQETHSSAKLEKVEKVEEKNVQKAQPVKQGSQSDSARTDSPAGNSSTSKSSSVKTSKLNLDKPMPSLPPPSSRYSEHMRVLRATDGPKQEDAPPVPTIQDVTQHSEEKKEGAAEISSNSKQPDVTTAQAAQASVEPLQERGMKDEADKKQAPAMTGQTEGQKHNETARGPESAPKGPGLSAFPSVPQPPQYYSRGVREGSPSNRPPMAQRPPPGGRRPPPPGDRRPPPPGDRRHPPPPRDQSPGRRFPPGHPLNRPQYPPFMPGSQHPPNQPGPPRSKFYGRQSESPNASQTSLVEPAAKPPSRDGEAARDKMTSPEPRLRTQSPANQARSSPSQIHTSPVEQNDTPVLEAMSKVGGNARPQLVRKESEVKEATPDAKPAHLEPSGQRDHLQRPSSPANVMRAPSPSPSQRPGSAGDLLNKASADKSLPGLPQEPGPRPITPDAASILTADIKTVTDPMQTLRDLTKQSEALHARHTSLRADRLKLSTAISASLKDSKPGPEYANSLLDQHLSLNAINSSLDICFAKLKSLDCKKEEAIQALIEQSRERPLGSRRHRKTTSLASHSTQASISGHSSKPSTPDIGSGPLPVVQERDSHVPAQSYFAGSVGGAAENLGDGRAEKVSEVAHKGEDKPALPATDAYNESSSLVDGLPTPRATAPAKKELKAGEKQPSSTDISPVEKTEDEPSKKRNTMVKMPSVSPAPSLFTREPVEMSPVSPIEGSNDIPADGPKRITVKGAKAAKILGLVGARSESPSNITLPDASPTETRNSPAKEFSVEVKIQRKPVPGSAPKAAAPPPTSQPGRKRTNDSASTVQTDSSPESEVRTPRESQDGMVPKGLKIGKRQVQRPVQVLTDDDILDYYSR